ncbi:putative toxin-antitoxin system toxin component, PIN family [Pelomonas sp. KK5]|uniref:PIN domain-containing protein n=1 Tax=Pelomonas sp. KK5 TaxID=1855730 RepID=UPI00097C9836|nr:PIN domain-containing protein [Pelomonas sp. KK5]
MSGTRVASPAVVFDTATLLRSLLLGDERAKALRQAWQQGRCRPLIDAEGAQALMRALACPALKLSEEERHEVLADFLPYAQAVPAVPVARSQPALALAEAGRAALLVSDCGQLRASFERRFSRRGKPACRLLGSDEFYASLQT